MTTATFFVICIAAVLTVETRSLFLPKSLGQNLAARERVVEPKKRPFCNAFTGTCPRWGVVCDVLVRRMRTQAFEFAGADGSRRDHRRVLGEPFRVECRASSRGSVEADYVGGEAVGGDSGS
jgi:hypothetical protein